jgi:RNA polymerase sigma-70 factor, ECF subfamily
MESAALAPELLSAPATDHPLIADRPSRLAVHVCHSCLLKELFMGTMSAEMAGVQEMTEALPVSAREEMTVLISERLPYFHRIALRRVDNAADAEDAVQDAFLSAWKHLDNFRGQAKMSTWLTTIVMNSARMVVRKRVRLRHLSIEGEDPRGETLSVSEMLADSRPDPEAQVRRRELEHRLGLLSLHLSLNSREMIRLRGKEGLSIRETADALGLTESAVKTRAARARGELKRLDKIHPARVVGPTGYPQVRRRRRAMSTRANRV